MPRDGAVVLSDVHVTPRCRLSARSCGRRGTYNVAPLMERHGDTKLIDLLPDARQLPEGALDQHP